LLSLRGLELCLPLLFALAFLQASALVMDNDMVVEEEQDMDQDRPHGARRRAMLRALLKQLDEEVESSCCVCKKPWAIYRGAKTCSVEDCKIPVIVCTECQEADPKLMKCPLCESGDKFKLRNMEHPKFINRENATQKRKVDPTEQRNVSKRLKHAGKDPSKRIFVGKLPLVMDATKLADILEGTVKVLRWIPDRRTGFWYGSVFAEMSTLEEAETAVKRAQAPGGIKVGKRSIVVNFAPPHDGEEWPPADHKHFERPPIPVS